MTWEELKEETKKMGAEMKEKTIDIGLTFEENWLVRQLLSDFLMMLEKQPDSELMKDLHKRAAKLLCRFEKVYGGRIGLEKYKENDNV